MEIPGEQSRLGLHTGFLCGDVDGWSSRRRAVARFIDHPQSRIASGVFLGRTRDAFRLGKSRRVGKQGGAEAEVRERTVGKRLAGEHQSDSDREH